MRWFLSFVVVLAMAPVLSLSASEMSPPIEGEPFPESLVLDAIGVKTEIKATSLLTGPETVAVGRSAIVKLGKADAGADFDWQVQPSGVNWISGDNRNETFVILLDLDPGRYFVSFTSYDQKKHETHVIEVGGDPSPPDPDPAPTPNPPGPAPLPDGKFKLAAQSRDWTTGIPTEHLSASKALANSFRGIIAAIAAGTLTKPADILAQTRSSNNAALGASTEAWKPWGAKLQSALEKLDADGTLRTPDDYKVAWGEIATGLEAVAPPPKAPRIRR